MPAFFTTKLLQEITHGQPQNWRTDNAVEVSLSTDTRTIGPGQWFVPLTGERFDGHDHLAKAYEQGAVGAFVSAGFWAQASGEVKALSNILVVESPLVAYLQLARHHRQRINPKVVAITGSSGKTTTKEMLVQALQLIPAPDTPAVQKSEKNFNNEVGLCQTLLALEPGTNILVVEMGMRGLRQIALLSEYAQPDVAVITNVGTAHIGLLGSREAIAQAKSEIVGGLNPETGMLIYDGDEPLLKASVQAVWQGRSLPVSFDNPSVKNIQSNSDGCWSFEYDKVSFQMPDVGRHHVANALAILNVGKALGFSPEQLQQGLTQPIQALERYIRYPIENASNAWLVDDTYNANPDSMRASILAFLSSLPPQQRAVLVLGDMKELGEHSESLHRDVGVWLAEQRGWHCVVVVGSESKPLAEALIANDSLKRQVSWLKRLDEVLPVLQRHFKHWDNTSVLLKASRALGLEGIRTALCSSQSTETAQHKVTAS